MPVASVGKYHLFESGVVVVPPDSPVVILIQNFRLIIEFIDDGKDAENPTISGEPVADGHNTTKIWLRNFIQTLGSGSKEPIQFAKQVHTFGGTTALSLNFWVVPMGDSKGKSFTYTIYGEDQAVPNAQ